MGESTGGERVEPSSRDQNLRRERGQKLEDRGLCTKNCKKKKILARKKRRRGKTGRRAARRQASNDRDRARRRELVIATHNVRTMAVDGKHGMGRAAEVLDVYQEMGCDIIGLQETRRSGQSALLQTRYVAYCSGESGGDGEGKKGQGGVELAVRSTIAGVHQRQATEGDVRIVRSSSSCDVRCWVCTNRHSICWEKNAF